MATTCTGTPLIGKFEDGEILDGETLTVDENNIVTYTVRYLIEKTSLPNKIPKQISEVGTFSDFVLDSWSAEALNDSTKNFVVTANYKTLDQTKKDGDFDGEFGVVESMDYDFSEEPLEAHPNIKVIAKKYGGVPQGDGTYYFPSVKPADVSTSGLGGSSAFGGAGADVNPLSGMKTYPALQARYNKTFGTVDKWKKYVSNIAKITATIPDSSLDAALGSDKAGRDWLQLPPKIQKEGKFYRVSVDYLLSAPGKKWPKDVFEDLT
jgi:hypothetical protein